MGPLDRAPPKNVTLSGFARPDTAPEFNPGTGTGTGTGAGTGTGTNGPRGYTNEEYPKRRGLSPKHMSFDDER